MSKDPLYQYFDDQDLNRETLIEDSEFEADARSFLQKRNEYEEGEGPQTSEEVYDAFMEHMRFQDVNEVTAVRDLMYASEASTDDKLEFGRLVDVYDRMEGEDINKRVVFDYLEAGITAPSTWLGLITGGFGKMGAVGTAQVAKTGIRAALKSAGKKLAESPDAVKGALVEGTFGLGAGAAQEGLRVETGVQDEFTGGRTLISGAASAVGGAIPASIYGAQQTRAAEKALDLRAQGQVASEAAEKKAQDNVKKKLNKVKDKSKIEKTKLEILGENVKDVRETLSKIKEQELKKEPLDKELVKKGNIGLQELTSAERTLASLPDEVIEKLTVAALEIGDQLKTKGVKEDRIGTLVSRALGDGTLDTPALKKILNDLNLSEREFSYLYLADLSNAGRKLGQAGRIGRMFSKERKEAVELEQKDVDRLVASIEDYLQVSGTPLTREAALEIIEDAKISSHRNTFQNIDRFRLSMMTGQLATTVRNFAGGGFRVAMDILDTSFKNMFKLGKEYDNPLAVSKYLFFNQPEARVVRELFSQTRSADADKFFGTFLETAVASARFGGDTLLTKTGATINVLNRVSDNMYKQAVFAGKLDQQVRRTMSKNVNGKAVERSLADVIRDGEFKQISEEAFQKAIDESLEFVYQKYPSGKNIPADAGKLLIKLHQRFPFLISAFVPFPRFVINQLDFVATHMPLFGYLTNVTKKQGPGFFDAETNAKQLTGLAMLSAAYDMRARQGPESEWYLYRTSEGKEINMMPIAGPFNAFLLAADVLYRYNNGKELKKPTQNMKAAWQALGGPSFRAGTGLYTLDRVLENYTKEGDLSEQTKREFAKVCGDIVNTFTLPLATVRDLVSLTDDQMRFVPQTDYVNVFDIFAAHATKSLPEIPGVPEVSLSEGISDLIGTGVVSKFDSNIDMITGRERRIVDPFEKQLFGIGKQAKSTPLQKALMRLQMSPYELYKPADYPIEDRLMREMGGAKFADRLNKYVQSDAFLSADAKQQKNDLRGEAQKILKGLRTTVRKRIRDAELSALKRGEESLYSRAKFEQLDGRMKEEVRSTYENEYPGQEFNATIAMETVYPKILKRRGKTVSKKAKGGYVSGYAIGGLLKSADEIAEAAGKQADKVDDLDDLSDDELLGYTVDTADDSPFIDKETLNKLETAGEIALETLISFTPVVGDVYDAYNVADNLKQAKYVDAAIDAIGFVPVIGNAISRGVKLTVETFKNSDPVIKRRALGSFVRSEGRLPDLQDTGDVENLIQQGAKEEKIVAGLSASRVDQPLFFGGTELSPARFKRSRKKHGELGVKALSTSRDPIYSAKMFQKGPVEEMTVLRSPRGIMSKQDMPPRDYDALRDAKLESQNPPDVSSIASKLPTQIPKNMFAEAETILQELSDDIEISQLKDNPKLLKKVTEGLEKLEDTIDLFEEAEKINVTPSSKKEAMLFYNTLKKALKKAEGLGAYTSGAGARGTYDGIIQRVSFIPTEGSVLQDNIGMAAMALEGTQRGDQLDTLLEAMREINESAGAFLPSSKEVADQYTLAKKVFMEVTDAMNRGGLASRK
jgi:hypothetical protein